MITRKASGSCIGLVCFLYLLSVSMAFAMDVNAEKALVNQYFPQNLIAESKIAYEQDGTAPSRMYDYVDVDFDGSGEKGYIVAVYSNGFSSAVRVLKAQGGGANLVASPSLDLGGIMPSVSPVDVDGDGIPEVFVSFSTFTGEVSNDYILKWVDGTLVSMAPFLDQAYFVDLSDDGKKDVIAKDMDGPLDQNNMPLNLLRYVLADGQYKLANTLYFFNDYTRSKGKPVTLSGNIMINSAASAFLTIYNGGSAKKDVSSAEIELNGVPVVTQSDFNQQAKVIKKPIALKSGENTVSVTLYGAPGSQMYLSVEASTVASDTTQ